MSGRVLLAAWEPRLQTPLAALLADEGGFEVRLAALPDGLTPGEIARIDCALFAGLGPGVDPLQVIRRLRGDERTRELPVVLLAGNELAAAAWTEGADAVFPESVPPEILLARVAALVALVRRREAEQGGAGQAQERLHRWVELILELADAASPGLRSRGDEIAWIAGQLATRFNVPEEFYDDLILAARLHGLGRALLHDRPGREAASWRWAAASAGELTTVPGLRFIAELIAGSGEHWDGSGPGGLQRGMISMRSRILRTAVDLVDAADRYSAGPGPRNFAKAAASLEAHAGTFYDPAVVAEVQAMLVAKEPDVREVRRVPVEALEPGMMLAEDLVTASGVKLLAAGGVLTSASLATITRRHLSDPIVHAVRVRPAARQAP